MKVREYNDTEARDLWEYELNLSPDQVDWMVRHAWETGATWFDYFFFRENCSYHLLSLLELAEPSLHLRSRFTGCTPDRRTARLDSSGALSPGAHHAARLANGRAHATGASVGEPHHR